MSAALRELLAKATPGPWMYQEQSDAYTHIVRADGRRFICQLAQDTSGVAEANARLMAEAINALPALLAKSAEYDALVARVEAAPVGTATEWGIQLDDPDKKAEPGQRIRLLVSDDRPSQTAGENDV